jgi:hypothetical protein
MSEPLTAQTLPMPASVDRLRQRALIVAVVGIAGMVAGYVTAPDRFFHAYLLGFLFWSGLSLGCLALMMIHNLSGGQWGLVTRRVWEAGAQTLPLMLVLFVPLTLGLPHVYEWAQPERVAADPILQHKAPFLNTPFWIARTVVMFVLWSGMAWLLARWSREQDAGRSADLDPRFARLSGPGLVVYGLTVSLASVDWMMSVDPHWFSTIYGFVMMAGHGLIALAFSVLMLSILTKDAPMAGVVQPKHVHDLGKLMFAFVMLYAYLTFSQFLIIWSANLPEEIPWYIKRFKGSWQYLTYFLIVAHFALPFLVMLSADVKRNLRRLTWLAALLFVMRYLDTVFQVEPQFHDEFTLSWIGLSAALGIGGLWFAAFTHFLKGRPVLPVHDPYFHQVLAADHGAH